MLACGLTLREALPIANRAGGIVVGKFGTATVTCEEFRMKVVVTGAAVLARRACRRKSVSTVRREALMRVVVTGAAGFIGSSLVLGLNRIGIDDVIAVDDLTDGAKFATCSARRSVTTSTSRVLRPLARARVRHVDAVFHEGACSDTMVHDGASCSTATTAAPRTCSTPARRSARACSMPRRRPPTAAARASARSRRSRAR